MRTRSRTALALIAATCGASCTALLGGFDFDGKGTGSGGGSSSIGATNASSSSGSVASASSSSGGGVCSPGATQPCYTGPAGTEDAGICMGGTSTCNDAGTAFEACAGEVTPQPKTCSSGKDDACDGLPCVVWAQGYGPAPLPDDSEINAVALNPKDGSVIITGDFQGTLNLGADSVSNTTGASQTFVARIAADGTLMWAQVFPITRGVALVVDASENIFVGGKSDAVVTIGSTMFPSGNFVLKLGPLGEMLWATNLGDTSVGHNAIYYAGISSIALASDGDVVVAGHCDYPPQFTDGTLQGTGYTFIAKISSVDGTSSKATTGTHWAQFVPYSVNGTPPSSLVTAGPKVAAGGGQYIYLASVFTGTVQLCGGPYTATTGGTDVALAMFDLQGNCLGSTSFGNGMLQWVDELSADSFGNLLLAGQVQGTLAFSNPSGTIAAKSSAGDGFVVKLNVMTAGALPGFAWGMTTGTNGEIVDVGFDGNGNARALGWFTGSLDLGVGMLTAGANRMMVLAELEGTLGTPQWNRGWIYPGTSTAVRLAVAPAGDEFVGGALFAGPFDIGTGALVQPTDNAVAWAGRFGP